MQIGHEASSLRGPRFGLWLMVGFACLLASGCGKRQAVPVSAVEPVVIPSPPAVEPVPATIPVGVVEAEGEPTEQEQDSFWSQAETLFQEAKDKGRTTASSTGDWLGEMLGQATTSTQSAGRNASDWVGQRYQEAVKSGETTASSAKQWVMDDLGKMGAWQYRVVHLSNRQTLEQELNQLGQERWECFAVEGEMFYLKRAHRSFLRQLPARDLLRLLPLLQLGAGDDEPAP